MFDPREGLRQRQSTTVQREGLGLLSLGRVTNVTIENNLFSGGMSMAS